MNLRSWAFPLGLTLAGCFSDDGGQKTSADDGTSGDSTTSASAGTTATASATSTATVTTSASSESSSDEGSTSTVGSGESSGSEGDSSSDSGLSATTDGSTSTAESTSDGSTSSSVTVTTTDDESSSSDDGSTSSSSADDSSSAATSSAATSDDGGESSSESGTMQLECTDVVLEPAYGDAIASVFTTAEDDTFAGSCGGLNSKDRVYQWTVPFDDWFVIDTVGSNFDTVLHMYDDCNGNEVACNDDFSVSEVSSRIVGKFDQGDTYVLVLDGNVGTSGDAVLNINPITCPAADLTGQPLPNDFTTVGGPSVYGGACGGDGHPERSFRFIPTVDGLYRFSTLQSGFESVVALERGAICGGELLGCNGKGYTDDVATAIVRRIQADQPVTLYVDGRTGSGTFTLDIENLPDACPSLTALPAFDEDLFISNFTDHMTTTCGQNGSLEFGVGSTFADATVVVDSPMGASCSVWIEADFPASAAVLTGEVCDGVEAGCELSTPDDGAGKHKVTIGLPFNQRSVVVVSPTEPDWQGNWYGSGAFRMSMGCVI